MPRIDDVADMLLPTYAVLTAFDAKLTAIGEEGEIGRLFARLDAVHSSGAEGSTTTFTDLMKFEAAPDTAPDPDDAAAVAACADAFASALPRPQDPVSAAKDIHRRLFERSPNRMVSSGAGRLKTALNATSDPDEPGGQFFYTSPPATPKAMDDWSRLTAGGGQRAAGRIGGPSSSSGRPRPTGCSNTSIRSPTATAASGD